MNLKLYDNKEKFLEENLKILLKEEEKNEIMIGIILEQDNLKVNKWFLGRIEDNNDVKVIFFVDDDKQGLLFYFVTEDVTSKLTEFLIDNIISNKINLKEISGNQHYSNILSETYMKKTNKVILEKCVTDTLKLEKIKEEHVLNENEILIKIEKENADLDKMGQIVKDIHLDTYGVTECSDEDALRIANIYLKKGLYILTDKKEEKDIFCHAVVVRKQINGCAIGAVLSPREYRGKGYGKKCIYSLCEKLLKEKNKYVVLHVREGNIAARSVYEKIGFEMIERCERINFK